MHFPYDTVPLLMRFRPDVVFAGEMGFRTLQASIYRRLFPESALVIWAKVSDATEQGRGRLRHWLRTSLLGITDAVVVNGESGANYISAFGVSRDRIFPVPATTDLAPFLSLPVTRPRELRHRLLYSGMLTERKNLLALLSHLADWAMQNPARQIEFRLLGDGPLRPAIAAFNRPPNLALRLLGTATYDQLPNAYGDAGILVFPTLADEWGMVVTEAMASGVPVLGSRYSQAVEELVKDGHNGWSFRPDDPRDLRSALDRALQTPAPMLDQMAVRARADISGITPAAVADRMMSAFEFARSVNRHNIR